MKFILQYAIVLLNALVIFTPVVKSQDQRPNFIFILTDDQTYGSMGCTGNPEVETPNLDHLAGEGVLFTNAHVTSAICTPSRVSIFLSQFERKHGVNFNSGTSVSDDAWKNAYPIRMREAGYYTGYIGKNHAPVGLGGYESQLMEKSFDYWYAAHGHLRFYPKEHHQIFQGATSDTQVEILEEGGLDFLSRNKYNLEGAKHFLENRPRDKPFCLSLCFNLPHGAGTGTMEMRESDPEIYKTAYRDQQLTPPKHYLSRNEITVPKLPVEIHHAGDRQDGYNYVDTPETMIERRTRQYQAMTGIDRMVGNLRQRLEELDLKENTIIIFCSDHGLFMGEFGLGGKALCYEICTHVPLIIYSPFKHHRLRSMHDTSLVQSIDIAPTMLGLAGIDIPPSYQGKNLTGLLEGKTNRVREYVYTENLWSTHFGNPRCEAVQNHKWKYIRYYENNNISARDLMKTAKALGVPINSMLYSVHDPDIVVYRNYIEGPLNGEEAVYEELYDLENDPDETTNIALNPEDLNILKELRRVWQREIIQARGDQKPQVFRYTAESKVEMKSINQD